MSFDMEKYIYFESLYNTLYFDIKHKCEKKFPSDKVNVKKKCSFLSRAQFIRFTFNSQFIYKLKHRLHPSKTVRGIFHFRFCLVLIRVCIFVQHFLTLKRHNFFQNKNNKKATQSFVPRPLTSKL